MSKSHSKSLGLLFILLPPGGIVFILFMFTIVNALLGATTPAQDSESIELMRVVIDYALGFLGIIFVIALFILVPIGIYLIAKKDHVITKCDERSGKGQKSIIPDEIKGWSWGAAGLGWIWGVYHSVWISLLSFIPILNWVWWIVMGIKGNEWAWQKRRWKNIHEFQNSQRKWGIWGIVFFFLPFVLYGLMLLLVVTDN
jgi:hypothetical protein